MSSVKLLDRCFFRNNTVIQLLQGIQAALISLKSGQEALLGRQEALEKKQDAMKLQMTSFYNEFKDQEFPDRTIVTSTSIITDNLRIELTEETKRIVNTCTKIICDQLAALPSVQDLGTNPDWIKTGCVSIILSYSETMESILPDVTETGHQLQGLASSEEGIRSENTLVSSYLVGILASTIHE
ncbi:hypothetical protein PHYBLDRAFT_165549 [Phycomyces blakesleeanus NRRL 1555(-)]|uniref:Uncharacterized protein n=1 Tax=Phycomyces blakesleeanus (strain ATCC 8743b / DSM 1359 / FGSC 10004 / NBRC 33097 / NRRL 1555) TaxID=763407 RepID=A0A167P195_PHYB8|nr:hypothetical protein PHYBLDRAFT_165549 [Phycomyces blakesleeanus NRRL 1555(-)]OAD77056.1 hypothetical protein PHYBLDRAFT_165549 [Phycomyces blakesleeanus NRRL 1555(-)]|eukprot:XP_018295096.1 hypothetical protein PHYBLDRAFT_165549 [Phycomyces blakesleeanus NRRL 1555(-)]